MSTALFQITEHVIPCQYIREYPNAVKSEKKLLRLAIKEYRPLNNLNPSPGSITIIAAHGNGFPKENYEPLWDDLYHETKVKIGVIWFADCSHQGASGVLNEDLQGDDPNWFDHSRDLLHMINHFWDRMPRPIFGIGHSMGSAQLVQLSLMHPRLIQGLALMEPVILRNPPSSQNAAFLSSHRPDLWPSRAKAEASFRKNRFFQTWDPRSLERHLKFSLRDLPTALYPNSSSSDPSSPQVTLTTTKHQEAWTFVRPNFHPQEQPPTIQRRLSPDLDPLKEGTYIFFRPESIITLQNLPFLRPPTIWLFGRHSQINTPSVRHEKAALTGTGVGGSGGVAAGQVESVTIDGTTHMMPFEKVRECAEVLARWLERQVREFEKQEEFWKEDQSGKSERGMQVLSRRWMEEVRKKADARRPLKEKL